MAALKCSFRGCKRPVLAKGLCGAHYQQQRKSGSLKPIQTQFHGQTERERFEARIDKTVGGCWNWIGYRDNLGRGDFRRSDGKIERAHRAAWRLLVRKRIGAALVLHRCDNPACVWPEHLYLGTRADNIRDMLDRKRAAFGRRHPGAKLSEQAVSDIRTSHRTRKHLAAKHGVSPTTITHVRKGKTWRHSLTPPVI